jgi:PBP1b-binding outer membrane lipoprotein LpoB
MIIRFTIVLLFAVFLFACAENTDKKDIACATEEKKTLDIYKDSELAVLMRAMHDAMEEVKASIEQGNENIEVSDFASILTAEPTDPKVKEPQFEEFANDYIKIVKVLNENRGNLKAHFNKSIDACIACHKAYCTGPIKKIEKLKLY